MRPTVKVNYLVSSVFMQTFKTIIICQVILFFIYYSHFVTHNVVHFVEFKLGYWTGGSAGVNNGEYYRNTVILVFRNNICIFFYVVKNFNNAFDKAITLMCVGLLCLKFTKSSTNLFTLPLRNPFVNYIHTVI